MNKLIRPLMLIVPLFTGIWFPELHVLAGEPYNVIRWALCVMIYINVLQIDFADLKPCREHGFVLGMNILLGVLPFELIRYFFPDSVEIAQGAFFVGIAPTAAAAAVVVSLLGGRVGFAITGFMISNIGISFALLFLLPHVTGNVNMNFFLNVLNSLVTVIVIPLIAARLTRKIFPGILKRVPVLKNVSLCLWSCSIFIISAVTRNNFDSSSVDSLIVIGIMFLIAMVGSILNFTIGYWIGRKDYRSDSSQILGQKNTTFALFLALEYATDMAALAPAFYVIFHNSWNSWQLLRKKGSGKS